MKDVETHSIDQEPLPPELKWPRLQWGIKTWLDLIPCVLAFIVFFWPGLAGQTIPQYVRIAVGIPLLLAPVLVPVLVWLCKASYMVYHRAYYYPTLRQRALQEIDELDETRRNLFDVAQLVTRARLYEIAKAGYYQGRLYIVLNKPKSPKLAEGDMLLAVHKEDGYTMGWFKVTEVRDREYYAIGTGKPDALWLGHVQQQGEATITPHMAAIHLPQGETR